MCLFLGQREKLELGNKNWLVIEQTNKQENWAGRAMARQASSPSEPVVMKHAPLAQLRRGTRPLSGTAGKSKRKPRETRLFSLFVCHLSTSLPTAPSPEPTVPPIIFPEASLLSSLNHL